MQPLAEWLNALGLGQYAQRFADNDIDTPILRDLTDADLEKIGVSLGHRKRMLRAIAEFDDTAWSSEAARADAPQRRQLTVMFCDLVGSTPLSTRLDPEELREIIGAFHRCCVEQIAKSDGVVARYMGDGMLVYFGYPQAHEDDAERAVRAGLALVGAVAQLGDGAGMALQVRVGIATGLVVVGDLLGEGLAQEHQAIGETPYGKKIGTAEEPVLHWAIALAGGPELGRWEASWFPRLHRLPRSPNRSAHGPGLNLGRRSRRLLMVIAQEPTQSLPALNRLRLVGDMRITREQQDVTLALVIALDMIMFDIFVQRPPQRALAQADHFGQALLLHRPNPAPRIGIQVRTAGRQR